MSGPAGKQDRLYEILHGASSVASPFVDRSALGILAAKGPPEVPPSGYLQFSLIPVIIGLSALFVGFFDRLPTPTARAIASTVFLSTFFIIWYLDYREREGLRTLTIALERPLEELNRLRTYITGWLRDLDKRTSKYFHCVTNTKVTDYFVLSQISTALFERVETIAKLLSKPSRENLLSAYQLLQGTLVFFDGVVLGTGTAYAVPLAKLSYLVGELIGNLEEGLRELEEEIDLYAREHPAERPRGRDSGSNLRS